MALTRLFLAIVAFVAASNGEFLQADYSLVINYKKFGSSLANGTQGQVRRLSPNIDYFAPGPDTISGIPDATSFQIQAIDQSLAIQNATFNGGASFELGTNLSFDLLVQLGTDFISWEGDAVSAQPIGFDPAVPFLSIAKPLLAPSLEAIAVFDYGFTSAKFTFNGNSANSITVNTMSGSLSWSQIQNLLVVGTNNVSIEVLDKFGSTDTETFTFDSFSPSSAVPEPSSLLLFGSVGLGVVGWRRRKSFFKMFDRTTR